MAAAFEGGALTITFDLSDVLSKVRADYLVAEYDPDRFVKELETYIDWCNNVRIKRRLNGSSLAECRLDQAA